MPGSAGALARESGSGSHSYRDYGHTALHQHARFRGGCPQVLIELGAEVNVGTGGRSGTPLHSAEDGKNMAGVDVLLAHGAGVNARNREGRTPLEYGLQRASNMDLLDQSKLNPVELES